MIFADTGIAIEARPHPHLGAQFRISSKCDRHKRPAESQALVNSIDAGIATDAKPVPQATLSMEHQMTQMQAHSTMESHPDKQFLENVIHTKVD
jgi:hypothetical protein